MASKKSAFDVLMNKINKKDDSRAKLVKESKKEPKSKDTDIIILADDHAQLDENNKKPETPRKRAQVLLPLHVQHIRQYTDQESSFLKEPIVPNFPLKKETEVTLVALNQRLNFDFSKYNSIMPDCSCSQSLDNVTFSISSTIDSLDKRMDTLSAERTDLSDTLNDATLDSLLSEASSPARPRQFKRRRTEQETKSSTDLLWTEKYQFSDERDIVGNKSQIERLKEWLNGWKSSLSKNQEARWTDDSDSDSDFAYDSDYSNSESFVNGRKFYSNAILLSGPHGSGKTSSVYSVAKQLGFKVFEVNSSTQRCKSQIIQELDGALNSHHVSSNKAQPGFKMDQFFKCPDNNGNKSRKRKNSLRREAVLTNASGLIDQDKTSINIHKESLILFDEIDIVFREDVGFWSAVNHFIKKSKKPIVLTTSDEFIQEKVNLNVERIDFGRPRIDAAVRFLKLVAKDQSTHIGTSTAYRIAHECRCDMRKCINQLQLMLTNMDRSKCKKLKNSATQASWNLNSFFVHEAQCALHPSGYYLDHLLFTDRLSKRIVNYLHLETGCAFNQEQPVNLKRYDLAMLKDGLSDHTTGSFSPFVAQTGPPLRQDLSKLNTTFVKENLFEFFNLISYLLNGKEVGFGEWMDLGRVNVLNYGSNVSVNRLAQALFRSTSSPALALDYRPCLHQICKMEHAKQTRQANRRRFVHYLSNLNLGLVKEDYVLLASSALDEHQDDAKTESNFVFDPNIFSNE